MRALVTGATGFLGGHLCDQLVESGVSVRGTVRRKGPLVEALVKKSVEVVDATLEDVEALANACDGVEVVYHVAALASYLAPPSRIEAANVVGTRNVLAAAKRAGVRRLVLVSTESVSLQNAERKEIDEESPLPTSYIDPYSRSKAQSEREVLAANGSAVETVAVRPPWIWGERDRSVLRTLMPAIKRGQFWFPGNGSNRVTPCHARNVALALQLAGESPKSPGRVYYVADDGRPTCREFIQRHCQACEVEPPRRFVPYPLLYGAAATFDFLRARGLRSVPPIGRPIVVHLGRTWDFSDKRIRDELGYKPQVSIDQGFQRLAAWVREEGGVDAALRRPR